MNCNIMQFKMLGGFGIAVEVKRIIRLKKPNFLPLKDYPSLREEITDCKV